VNNNNVRFHQFCAGLFFALLIGPAVASPLTQTVSVSPAGENGKFTTRTTFVDTGGSVSVQDERSVGAPTHVQSPHQNVRLLVRLKDRPLTSYVQALRAQNTNDPKAFIATHQKSVQTHQQRLQKTQSRVIDDLRRKKMLDAVHHQFTSLTNTLAISTMASNVEEIRKLPEVAAVYPDNKVSALLEESLAVVGTNTVWNLRDRNNGTVTGQGITIAVLDTGINYRHPDLGGCLGAQCKVIGGYNFVEGEDFSDPMDFEGHGTHVAGIVAANGTLKGVAPDAKLYAFKVLDNAGNGLDSAIIAGLERATDPDGNPLTDDQVDVINMSLGGWGEVDSPLSEAVNAAMDAGIVVVVAAGNEGSSYSTIGSPGNVERAITVGATDNADVIAPFSSRGPVTGRAYVKPELLAPGVDINSTSLGNGYAVQSGTSMAAPHVAGAVALLKQLHPELTPQDIKSLLIANSVDIGEDLFTQGAGRMDIAAAARANLIISPPLFSFGYVDLAVPQWQKSIALNVKNISGQSRSFSVANVGSLPQGAEVELSETGEMNLASGESKNFTAVIDVDTTRVPFPDTATMHFESAFELRSGAETYPIPFAFGKATLLRLNTDARIFATYLWSDDGAYTNHAFYACDSEPVSPEFAVKPGLYHLMVSFANESCTSPQHYVFKEQINVIGETDITVSKNDAIHDISVDIVNEVGETMDLTDIDVRSFTLTMFHPDSNATLSSSMAASITDLAKFSEVSENIRLDLTVVLENNTRPREDRTAYLTQGTYPNGLKQNEQLMLDLRSAGKIEFDYRDRQALADGVLLYLGGMQTASSHDWFTSGSSTSDILPYYTPFKITYYSTVSDFDADEFYPVIRVDKHDVWALGSALLETGPIVFPDKNTYAKVKGVRDDREVITYQSDDNTMLIENGTYFFSSSAMLHVSSNSVNSKGYNFNGIYGLLKDSLHNTSAPEINYSLRCDNKLIDEAKVFSYGYYFQLNDNKCQSIDVEFQIPTRLYGFNDTSTIRYFLNSQSTLYSGKLAVESPMIEEIAFFNYSKPSRVLNSNDASVNVRVSANSPYLDVSTNVKVTIEYRLDNSATWNALNVIKTGENYHAHIPVIEGTHIGSMRITADDGTGNSVTQTLNSVFLIGSDAESLQEAAPIFGELPPLTIEATALLTPFLFPDVLARDQVDGDILATTETPGPFRVGVYDIKWTAKNSAGITATAIQKFSVTDTTSPVVIAPAAISVRATGAQTTIALGTASATDLVDGVLTATPDKSGPFTVGEHRVNWLATDAAGNTGSATQMVTVTAAPAVNPPPVSGGSGGGGAASLWILLFLGMYKMLSGNRKNYLP
jgi:minor extracellular serine protease Vpr